MGGVLYVRRGLELGLDLVLGLNIGLGLALSLGLSSSLFTFYHRFDIECFSDLHK